MRKRSFYPAEEEDEVWVWFHVIAGCESGSRRRSQQNLDRGLGFLPEHHTSLFTRNDKLNDLVYLDTRLQY